MKNHISLRLTLIIKTCVLLLATTSFAKDLATHQAKPLQVASFTVTSKLEEKNVFGNAQEKQAYRLRIGDKLRFELLNTKYKISSEIIVDNLGSINLEYINWIDVKGKTLQEATDYITKLYAKDYFVSPNVKLRLVEKAKLRYKILGQVANPGFYEVPPGLEVDLLDAIAIAGGYTRIAGKITFKAPLAEGGEQIKTFKIKELTKSRSTQIPNLNGDETIIVGESFF